MTKEELMYEKKTVYERGGRELTDRAYAYSEGYKAYLDFAKIERESVDFFVAEDLLIGKAQFVFWPHTYKRFIPNLWYTCNWY